MYQAHTRSGVLALAALLLSVSGTALAASMPLLGTTQSFAILAGSGITNTGPTTVTGDIGTFPTLTETGFASITLNGTNHVGDAVTQGAKTALVTAYNDVAGQLPVSTVPTELGGTIKQAGIYDTAAGTLGITGTLTLDAQGDPDSVFIFKAASTLITASSSSVNLINGASACNVFWLVGSSATLGTNSSLKGTILAMTSVTLTTGASVEGRVLARNGAVTLDSNVITRAVCAPPVGVPGTGTISVVKTVINDNGGTRTIADFPLFVNGAPVTSGTTNAFAAPATYTITETTIAQYARSFSGDCDASGHLNLVADETAVCIITNNDIAVGGGGIIPPIPPLIDVVKVPNPLALPDGPGLVTYTYTLINVGTVPVTNVTLVGDTCSPIVLDSGDTDSDGALDVSEIWIYRCSTTLTETHTNTVVASGWANGLHATDIASARVTVGSPFVPPLIHVTKIPRPLTLLATGGMVTYTERVSNPGTVPLSNVRLTDDTCAPMAYNSGDLNSDTLLDPSETWVYTCRTNVLKTTMNTATAVGQANGMTVRDFAVATVVVATSVPRLPNTGIKDARTVGASPDALRELQSSERSYTALPVRLRISALDIDAAIEHVGLTPQGAVGAPEDFGNAAWFNLGARPGDVGNALIDGHFGWKSGRPAVFNSLHRLRAGETITVEDANGTTSTFVVRALRSFGKSEDVREAFGSNDGGSHLTLITCEGTWDRKTRSFSKRLVIFADKI